MGLLCVVKAPPTAAAETHKRWREEKELAPVLSEPVISEATAPPPTQPPPPIQHLNIHIFFAD